MEDMMTLKQKKERRKKIGASVEKMNRRIAAKKSSKQGSPVVFKNVADSPATKNYHGETGLVSSSNAILHHSDEKIRRLAGQYVKILTETAERYEDRGEKKIRVVVLPLELSNPEQVIISLDNIKSSDPVVNGLRA